MKCWDLLLYSVAFCYKSCERNFLHCKIGVFVATIHRRYRFICGHDPQKVFVATIRRRYWCICGHDPQKVPVYLWPQSTEGTGVFVATIHRRYRFICGHDPQKVPWHSCYLSPKSRHGASTNWLCTLHRFCNVKNSKPHFSSKTEPYNNNSLFCR